MNLFCFPYAGGSASIFKDWKDLFPSSITVLPFELSGHGMRITENCYTSHADAIDKILAELTPLILNDTYSLFGHSMGGSLVYLLIHEIKNRKLPAPQHIFISGCKPPHLEDKDRGTHLLDDEDFLAKLKDYGATPPEFFENKELVDFYLPILKKDFLLSDLDKISIDDITPFEVPISVFYGTEEDIEHSEAQNWALYTFSNFTIHPIEGDHFFIDESYHKVIRVINKTLLSTVHT